MKAVPGFESVSTWRQPVPAPASAARTGLITGVAARVAAAGPGRLRVAVDGRTCAGKTSFGHELAAALRQIGRPTARASLDDFKNPWREARERGYDRLSGEGYYRNAYDFASARELLLGPAAPHGSGRLVLCAHDPLTGEDRRDQAISAPPGTVLVVDSVFAFRPGGSRGTSHGRAPRTRPACTGTGTARPSRSTWPRWARGRWPIWSSTTATSPRPRW
jgi:uridine kinase